MRNKLFLVLAIGFSTVLTSGCAISINGQQIGMPGMPQGPLGSLDPAALAAGGLPQQPGLTPGLTQPDPLTGAVAGALPQDPSLSVPGLTSNPPTFTPASPSNTPIDPNAATPAPVAGIPQATPIGSGPIDPASLPTLPAAGVNNNPLALAGAIPQGVPGL